MKKNLTVTLIVLSVLAFFIQPVFGQSPATGSLGITKVVDWNDWTADPSQLFEICITGPSYPTNPSCVQLGDGYIVTWFSLEPGEYTVTETDPGALWGVTGEGTFTVVADQTTTGTITNTYLKKHPGNLQVTKIVDWNGHTPDPSKLFEICNTGPSYPTSSCVQLGDGYIVTWFSLEPGDYIVAETDPGDLWSVNGEGTFTVVEKLTTSTTITNTFTNGQPLFNKTFSPNPITLGEVSTLTFTIDNRQSTAATSLSFTDNLPAGMVVAVPPNVSNTCTGGAVTAIAGRGTISYTGGTVAALTTCTISIDVTASSNGIFVNVTGDLTSSLGNAGTTSDTLTVNLGKPAVITEDVTSITSNSAFGGGTITSNGGLTITDRGVCWSTSHNPTTNDDCTVESVTGGGTGQFNSTLKPLQSSTMYYVRAFATNSAGTAYGEEKMFRTKLYFYLRAIPGISQGVVERQK